MSKLYSMPIIYIKHASSVTIKGTISGNTINTVNKLAAGKPAEHGG